MYASLLRIRPRSLSLFTHAHFSCSFSMHIFWVVTNFLSVKLPRFVGFEYYFEENYKGLKKEDLKNLRKKKYVSKYYTNVLNSTEKKKYVDLLLENSKYMNVRLPRNFFDLYKYPLEVLHHYYKK